MYKIVLNTCHIYKLDFTELSLFLIKQIFFVTIHLLEILITIPSNFAIILPLKHVFTMLRNAYLLCVFSKVPTVGGFFSPPTPSPARSLRSLAHIFQAPSSFLFSFTLEPRLPKFHYFHTSDLLIFMSPSRNFLLRYAPDCTFSSRKMKKLPTVGGGTHPPPGPLSRGVDPGGGRGAVASPQ